MLSRRDIPNLLTFARVAAVPVCLTLMLVDPPFKALALFWIFVAASLTDFLDGYLARKWNVVSPLGTLLDPIADKLLVALMLVYLLVNPIFLPVTVILLRELYISGLREFLAARQITLPVSKGGKWKTALQMVAIACLLLSNAYQLRTADAEFIIITMSPLFWLGTALLHLSALLAVTSAISYTRASWKHLRATQ